MWLLHENSPRDLAIAASIAAGLLLVVWAIRALAKRRAPRAAATATQIDDFLIDVARRTKLYLLLLPALALGARSLTVPRELQGLLRRGTELALIAQTAVWVAGMIDFWLRRYHRARIESDPAAVMTVNVFRLAAVVGVWVVAAVTVLKSFGVDVTTLIAGLGIGGVAVALATQNILGDLFASLSIVIDKPFVLGDAIMVDHHVGTVEHIGLKTTRLRSVDGEELIFSNGDLLKSRIRNFKRMTRRRSLSRLGVTYATPVDTLERIPEILRAVVEKQEETSFDRAHFVKFGDSAYEIELAYFVATADYPTFLTIQQRVNLDIIRAFQAAEIEFAFPTRTLFLNQS